MMSKFPDFDFKIDCGDDPRVRQWLHDNGVKTISGKSPVDSHKKDKYFFLRIHSMRCAHGSSEYYFREHNGRHINPYDYMQGQTVADRMAALIEQDPQKGWANWIAIDSGGYICIYEEKPAESPGRFYPDSGNWCVYGIVEEKDREFLSKHWRETLTELPNVKPGLIVAPDRPVDANKTIDNRAEIAARDERKCTPREAEVMHRVAAAEVMPATPKPLTIPSICLAEQTIPMMLGGEHGGRHDN